MADARSLLVPLHVDALLVNQRVVSKIPFARWQNVWDNLKTFSDPVPPPWGNQHPIGEGVHLHWQLPSALTHGKAPEDSTKAAFPYTPNRWIVVRLSAAVQGTVAQTMTAWIVESDFLDPSASTPYVCPDSTATKLKTTFMGRNIAVAEWTGDATGTMFLTATGIAQSTFLGYQPGLVDVYSFYDESATKLPEETCLTYLVAGWYSDAQQDPLVRFPGFDAQTGIFTDLRWQVLGFAQGGDAPTRSVFHGLVNDLTWQTTNVPPRADSNAASMQIAVAYTAIDALSAILAEADKSASPTPEQLELLLAAFQYDSLHLLDEPDAAAQLELRIRNAWFGSTPGGTLWQIVPVAQGQSSADPLSPVVQPSPAPLTKAQADWLAALNTAQRQCDVDQRELKTLQAELFTLWWKGHFIATIPSQLETWGIDTAALATQVYTQIDTNQTTNFFGQVAARQEAVKQQLAKVPNPASQPSIDRFSQQIPGNAGDLVLKPGAMPSFYQPVDPVLLIAGISPPKNAPENDQPLPCRLSTAAATGVQVQMDGSTVTIEAATGSLASIIQQPGTLPSGGGKGKGTLNALLPPAVASALTALATESFFADPNNTSSILCNGIGNSDPKVIALLRTAITNREAQIASIPRPLRAEFAFSLWQQAWSPLFLEWQLQFYPTVEPNLIGQSLPPQKLVASNRTAVQDNVSMDLAHWSFNGDDDVFQRGSEFYSWSGGDIWSETPWIVPSLFQGRSTLTPNAENLFLARLSEYIASQPVADAAAVLTGDAVSAVTLVNGGSGYSAPPTITISGGGGSGATAVAEIEHGVITGITLTAAGSGYTSTPQVTIGPGDWATIQSLIDALGETRFLSQTLSGFNDNLLMRTAMHVLPPDAKTAAVVQGENRTVPAPTLGNVNINFGVGQPFFFPARGGFFRFLQLQIVDGFGQVLDLLEANGNPGGNPSSFQPILGAGLLPDAATASPTYQMKQAPRIVQPSRLNLRWLDSFNDSEEVFLTPDTNPVCGWLLPNHLDRSIAVYDANGVPLGELLVLMQTGASHAVRWLAAPGSEVSDPTQIANPHLRDAMLAFTSTQGGIPVSERVDAFRAWFNSIDETLWTIEPASARTDNNLAVLIGRPLALTRAQVQFELFGRPAYNGSWRDTFDLATPGDQASIEVGRQEGGFTSLRFPIRLGSTELLQDGLIGYFTDDTYTAFNAVHAAQSPASPYIQPVAGTNYLSLPYNYPNYSAQNLTLLLDPLGTVHATTGILPVAELALPSQFYATALSNMQVAFRIGPFLTSPTTIRMPVPAAQSGTWTWVWQPTPGSFESEDIVVANPQPRLADAPPDLMEGWLTLSPSKSTSTAVQPSSPEDRPKAQPHFSRPPIRSDQ